LDLWWAPYIAGIPMFMWPLFWFTWIPVVGWGLSWFTYVLNWATFWGYTAASVLLMMDWLDGRGFQVISREAADQLLGNAPGGDAEE